MREVVGVIAVVSLAAAAQWPVSGVPSAGGEPERAAAGGAAGYLWPVRGRVLRSFEPPGSPFGPGHRGIDIAATPGTHVLAAERGIVAFAGVVAGERYVSVLHPDGIRTTYSWLSAVLVDRGDAVERGEVLGRTGAGHPGEEPAHLHLGARIGDAYLDPLLLLEPLIQPGLIRLAPLDDARSRAPP